MLALIWVCVRACVQACVPVPEHVHTCLPKCLYLYVCMTLMYACKLRGCMSVHVHVYV